MFLVFQSMDKTSLQTNDTICRACSNSSDSEGKGEGERKRDNTFQYELLHALSIYMHVYYWYVFGMHACVLEHFDDLGKQLKQILI